MLYGYYRKWLRDVKRPTGLLNLSTARMFHENRRTYTVLVLAIDKPAAFIEFRGAHIGMVFYDGELREYLSCQFEERKPGALFLTKASYRKYRGSSDAVSRRESYDFREDGAVSMEKHSGEDDCGASLTTTVDVSRNWNSYPDFGDYESILALDWVRKLVDI